MSRIPLTPHEEITTGLLQLSELQNDFILDIPASRSMLAPHLAELPADNAALSNKTNSTNSANIPTSNNSYDSRKEAPIELICSRFLEAVARSILLHTSDTMNWVRLGPRSFIGPLGSTFSKTLKGETDIGQPLQSLIVYALHLELLKSRTLLIACFPSSEHEIYSVYDALKTGLETPSAIMGRDVLLAPSGSTYSFDGIIQTRRSNKASTSLALHSRPLDDSSSQEFHAANTKASIIKNLLRQGIHVSKGEKWVRLRPKISLGEFDQIIGATVDLETRSKILLWPASFCFIKGTHDDIEDMDQSDLRKLSESMPLDPLLNAETWFRNKAARAKSLKAALEVQKQKHELEARLAEEASHNDEDDSQSDTEARLNQYLSTQDASRIYPTPPDGLRSEALFSQSVQEPEVICAGRVDQPGSNAGDAQAILSASRPPQSPGFDESTSHYGQTVDDDLFGDIDTGLFAASNLTEADFSFFDEPSEDDGVNQNIESNARKPKYADMKREERSSEIIGTGCIDIDAVSRHRLTEQDEARTADTAKLGAYEDQHSRISPEHSSESKTNLAI